MVKLELEADVDMLLGLADYFIGRGEMAQAGAALTAALQVAEEARKGPILSRLGFTRQPPAAARALLDVQKAIEAISPTGAFVTDGLAVWFKTLPFLDDVRFMALAEQHQHLLPIPNWQWNLATVLWAVEQASGIAGDLVELGVFRGHTTLFVADYVDFAAWPKRWLLYDTFDGVPDDQLNPGWAEVNRKQYKGQFSFEEVRDRFARFPNIEVVQGRAPQVFDQVCPEAISFLHMDLNSAIAEIQSLEVLFDRISPGGVVVFDDYCWGSARAQHEAEKRWFAERGLSVLPLATGQGLFVKR